MPWENMPWDQVQGRLAGQHGESLGRGSPDLRALRWAARGRTGCREQTMRGPEILSLLLYGSRLADPIATIVRPTTCSSVLRTCFDRRDGKVDADLLLRDVDGDGCLRGAGRHVHLHADHVAEDGHLAVDDEAEPVHDARALFGEVALDEVAERFSVGGRGASRDDGEEEEMGWAHGCGGVAVGVADAGAWWCCAVHGRRRLRS